MNLFNDIDFMSMISEEMISDHGEDSFCCALREETALIGVFDGCGGLGATTYPRLKNHTGAYLASRTVSGAIYNWFDNCDKKQENDEEFVAVIKDYITQYYEKISNYIDTNSKIRGSMVRDLPTTLAIGYLEKKNDNILLHVIWCGDSRIYLLDQRGLAQLTRDDVQSKNALSNLSDDGALTNVISMDGKYMLHHNVMTINAPTLIFAATDGCFGYVPSPMNFEYLILESICMSSCVNEFESILKKKLAEITGDDFSFNLISLGYKNYNDLKHQVKVRFNYIKKKYILPLNKGKNNKDLIQKLWKLYQVDYERYLET